MANKVTDNWTKDVYMSDVEEVAESFYIQPRRVIAPSFKTREEAQAYARKHFPDVAFDVLSIPAHKFAFVRQGDDALEVVTV